MLNAEFHQKSKIQHPKFTIVFNPPFNIQNSPLGFSSPQSIIQNPKLKHPMITWKRQLRTASEF
jgi:hypothetical protein